MPPPRFAQHLTPSSAGAEERDRNSGGTGLGLAIAQRAVRYHSGEVRAENIETGGLLVEITLPLSGAVTSG